MKNSKKYWRSLWALLLALCVVFQMSATACAAETGIDLQKRGSIRITLKSGGKPLPGVIFTLYRVADLTAEKNGNLSYRMTGDFEGCGADLDDLGAENLAEHLAAYARDGAAVATKTTDGNGSVAFRDLPLGLYLIVQEGRAQGYYSIAPFLVSVPMKGEDGRIYDVDAGPKVEPQPDQPGETKLTVKKVWRGGDDHRPDSVTVHLLKDGRVVDTVILSKENGWKYTWEGLDSDARWTVAEEVPEGYTVKYSSGGKTITITNTRPDSPETPTTPDNPKLIQTGQLNWPVPILAGAGMVLVVLGWLLMRDKRENCEQE